MIGTGVQILFAFLLTIAFQARFGQATVFERDLYVVTLVLSGLSAALLITPVALHRFLFKFGVKDEIVALTNRLAIAGLAVLSLCLVAGIILTSDEASGELAAEILWGARSPHLRTGVVRVTPPPTAARSGGTSSALPDKAGGSEVGSRRDGRSTHL